MSDENEPLHLPWLHGPKPPQAAAMRYWPERKPMQLPPLEIECPECNGTSTGEVDVNGEWKFIHCKRCDDYGRIVTPAGKALLDFLPSQRLEIKCQECGGNGHGYTDHCRACDGTGCELTEFGEMVFNMVARRFVRKRNDD